MNDNNYSNYYFYYGNNKFKDSKIKTNKKQEREAFILKRDHVKGKRVNCFSTTSFAYYINIITFALILIITSTISAQQDNFQQQNNFFTQYNTRGQYGQYGGRHFKTRERVSWCTTNFLEKRKCLDWAKAIEEVNIQFEGQEPFELNLDCVQGADKDQCMGMIDDERADMILLDPGEIGVAGRYHSLTPIMMERYASFGGLGQQPTSGSGNGVGANPTSLGHYSVAIVKKRSAQSIQSLNDLWGKKACFSGVSHMASWILPLASIIDLPRFEIADCNNLVKSASYFFGNSCAPNALINKFNPTGDNPQKMSALCEKQNGRVGAHNEPYNGVFSALKCLSDPILTPIINAFNFNLNSNINNNNNNEQQQVQLQLESLRGGDVAFLPHNTVFLAEKLNLPKEFRLEVPARNDLELLCPQGGRQPLDRWQNCNFGFVPAHAIIVSSRTSLERRQTIQRFLKTSVQLFSGSLTSAYFQQSNNNNFPKSRDDLGFNSRTNAQQGQTSGSFSFDLATNSPSSSSSSSSLFREQQFQQQQQQQQSDLSSSRFGNSFNNNPLDGLASSYVGRINTSFKLTGDYSFTNYPSLDVLFSSDMVDLVPLNGVGQTFKGFINSFPVQLATTGTTNNQQQQQQSAISRYFTYSQKAFDNSVFDIRTQIDYFEKLRRCSVPAAVLCITSEKEFNKCLAMSKAFHAAGLKPEINCKLAQSTLSCMQLIKDRDADIVVLDAAEIYLAGSKFNLIPIVSEQIEVHESNHYAVAVAKKSDQSTDLFSLKGKLSCHSGFLKGAGWVMPINFLLSMDRMRKYDNCDSARSAAEHFDRSCAPGILSSVSNTQNVTSWTIRNMCELCHGSGNSYCARDASELFYGDTGSFRCLVEGGGQVAFCKHTAIFENTGGSNRETWARNLIKSDFELLCRDGSRAPINEYKNCNLGTVPPNAIVTRGDTPFQLIEAYVNLFIYGQQYYGSRYSEEYTFKMFSSINGKDLIFQDATQQLVRVPLEKQTYKSYLNDEFLRAIETVFCNY